MILDVFALIWHNNISQSESKRVVITKYINNDSLRNNDMQKNENLVTHELNRIIFIIILQLFVLLNASPHLRVDCCNQTS